MTDETWLTGIQVLIESPGKLVQSGLSPEIRERLKRWWSRYKIYPHLPWDTKAKLNREGINLLRALKALDELKELPNDEEIKKDVLNNINYYLTKIELAQMRMLEKAQDVKRVKSYQLRKKIVDYKENEQEAFEIRAKEFSKQFHPQSAAHQFFKTHGKKIHFGKHIKRAETLSDVVTLASRIRSFLIRLGPIISTLIELNTAVLEGLKLMNQFLMTIPFIQSIAAAIPLIITSFKAWSKGKSQTKKAIALIGLTLIGVFLGLSIASAFATGIGLIGILAASSFFVIVDVAINNFRPWVKLGLEIKKYESQIDIYEKKYNEKKYEFDHLERKLLLIKLEKRLIKGHCTQKEFDEAKHCIERSSKLAAEMNPQVKAMLKNKKFNSLDAFFDHHMRKKVSDLRTAIDHTKVAQNEKYFNAVKGIFVIAGAILLCIPTPVTMFVGASILLTASIAGFVRLYHQFKSKNESKNPLFPATSTATTSEKKPPTTKPDVQPQPKPAQHLVSANSNTTSYLAKTSIKYPDEPTHQTSDTVPRKSPR